MRVNEIDAALLAIADLLRRPEPGLQARAESIADRLVSRPEFPRADRGAIERMVRHLAESDLETLQLEYERAFDNGGRLRLPALGSGPCRHQADQLPQFLEACASLPPAQAQQRLEQSRRSLRQMHSVLYRRGSGYALPVRLLLHLAHTEP